jgi:hypothetical protein
MDVDELTRKALEDGNLLAMAMGELLEECPTEEALEARDARTFYVGESDMWEKVEETIREAKDVIVDSLELLVDAGRYSRSELNLLIKDLDLAILAEPVDPDAPPKKEDVAKAA